VNDCVMTEVRDALPDLAHGRLSELNMATMTAHVESCADCRAELALLREVRDSAPLAPAMDAARIASLLPPYGGAAVVRHLPVEPVRKSAWRHSLLAVSAAAVLVIGGLTFSSLKNQTDRSGSSVAASATSPAAGPAPEASANSPATERVIAPARSTTTKNEPARSIAAGENQVASLSLVGGTQDLSETELETLLAELDGMDSMPAAEPQSVTLTVEDIEGGQ
jgi:Putative zinc-finger